MNVLIAGCGYVGSVLAGLLQQSGHVVYGLKRDASNLPDGVIAIQADLTDPDTLASLPQDIDHLVFLPTPASREQSAYEAIFIDGWKNIWGALKQPPKRTVLISSTAVFGQSDGSVVDENTEPLPVRFNGKVLLEMERLATSMSDDVVIARISGIYGPGREGMIRLAASEGLEVQQTPPSYTNRIHRDDVAAALLHLLQLEDPEALYAVTDDLPVARYEVLVWLAETLGNSAPKGLTDFRAGKGKRVSNQRLKCSGFQLKYPDYRAGYSSMLEERNINEHTS